MDPRPEDDAPDTEEGPDGHCLPRIHLSPPHMGGREEEYVRDALSSNWIAPVGPQLDAFEAEFARVVGASHAVALSSGTAALHLALQLVGVSPGDKVLVSTLTFAASVNPVRYLGGIPVFIDSERASWNLDPTLVAESVTARVRTGRPPRAVVVVHLYGQCADLDPVLDVCGEHGIAVVEDAAEALGATYRGRPAGTLGRVGIYSFNGNKIITTSGGGMLVSEDAVLVERARKLATQARESGAEYEHRKIGYNYRLSNVLAAIGRGQLELLASHVESCRRNFDHYVEALADLPGVAFQPEASWGRPTRWLSALTFDPATFGADREAVRSALAAENIEARPLWKPMHQQPAFEGCELVGGSVADDLFQRGLCLPSGSRLADTDLERVCDTVRAVAAHS